MHFFKFLCMSDKPRLHQLNIITSSRSSTWQASLTAWIFSFVGNTIKEGEKLRTNTKRHQLIKYAKIFYSIVLLVFHKFSYRTYQNGLSQAPQSWGTMSISKNTNHVSSIPFVGNPHFSILYHKSINSCSLLFVKDMIFWKQKFELKQLENEPFYV